MKVSELGEKRLVDRIQAIIGPVVNMRLASQDDASVFSIPGHDDLLVNTDMLVGRTDVPHAMDPYHVGVKALVMNASDLIVKGISPNAMVVSLGVPGTMQVDDVDRIITGIRDSAKQHRIEYLGGDVNETEDLIISITIFGHVDGLIVPRNGIKPGQFLVSTGEFGYTAAGLMLVLEQVKVHDPERFIRCTDSVLKPTINYHAVLDTARMSGVVASIDSSDGLIASLRDLMRVNDVGFLVDKLPVPHVVREFSLETGIPLEDLLFSGGEEYHGLFLVEPDAWPAIDQEARKMGHALFLIGHATREKKVLYKESAGVDAIEIRKHGFEHFTRARSSCNS